MKKIRQVKEYHAFMRSKGANMYIMSFLNQDGTEYVKGWVVSGYKGDDSHRYCYNKIEADSFLRFQTTK